MATSRPHSRTRLTASASTSSSTAAGAHSIEGRGAVAVYDANEDRLTLWSSTQLAHEVRAFLMTMLRLDENQLRVVAPDVGGGFGAKFVMYPEEATLAASCLLLRRPIRWIEDRREHFLAAVQEREQYWDLEVACDDDGRLLGVRGQMIHDEGRLHAAGHQSSLQRVDRAARPLHPACLRDRRARRRDQQVATMPVRGAGYPEGAFAMERLLDRIADELHLDRADVRRRNLVPPEKMPYVSPLKTRSGAPITLDSGDFPGCQRAALEAIDYARVCRAPTARAGERPLPRYRHRQRRQGHGPRSSSNPASCGSAAPAASPS
jgi:carbon-monoxide dehydrogenase large subunit